MAGVDSAEHVSPRVIKVTFDSGMRNNSGLRDTANYSVHAGAVSISSIVIPTAHAQEWVGPGSDGGSPLWVYLVCNVNPNTVADPVNVFVNEGGEPKFWDGTSIGVGEGLVACATTADSSIPYWEQAGLRLEQARIELSRLGKARFSSNQPTNYGIYQMLGRIGDLVAGGTLGTITTDIPGPLNPSEPSVVSFGAGGFSIPATPTPGLGDTITFNDKGIPCHVEKLWGAADGTNDLFRTSIAFHAFSMIVIHVPPPGSSIESGVMDATEWFSPDNGRENLVRFVTAPAKGSSFIAIFTPRQSLLRVNSEIIAYTASDYAAKTVEIAGRAQLCSEMAAHDSGSVVEDVWTTSLVGRGEYNLFVFGASGDALDVLARDSGAARSDNPSISDTELRRMVFNTAVSLRTNRVTVDEAIRYVYPDLYPYILYGEDVRWPGCITIWYSGEPLKNLGSIGIVPPIELWETWLDFLAYPDGFYSETLSESFYRDPITDVTYDGDYFTASIFDDPPVWPHPLVLSGADVYLIGTPAPYVPDPYWVSDDYKNYIVRPHGLDRALAAGVGVLLMDIGLIS